METTPMSSFGTNTGYVDDLYQLYLDDPSSVSEAWREFFEDYRPVGVRRETTSAAPASETETEDPPVAVATAVQEPPEKLTVTAVDRNFHIIDEQLAARLW